jgi:hypothetical protein
MHIYVHVYTFAFIEMYIHICIDTFIYVPHINLYINTHKFINSRIFILVYAFTYIHICIGSFVLYHDVCKSDKRCSDNSNHHHHHDCNHYYHHRLYHHHLHHYQHHYYHHYYHQHHHNHYHHYHHYREALSQIMMCAEVTKDAVTIPVDERECAIIKLLQCWMNNYSVNQIWYRCFIYMLNPCIKKKYICICTHVYIHIPV